MEKESKKVVITGQPMRRIEPEEFAKALGAELMTDAERDDFLRSHQSYFYEIMYHPQENPRNEQIPQ